MFHIEVTQPVYLLSMIFYVLYIIFCLAVLVRWQLARS